jgi:hypothetical protein
MAAANARAEAAIITRSGFTADFADFAIAVPSDKDARRAILSEYDRWAKKHPNDATMLGGFLFFRYLQNERTNLLDFRASDNDKWQIVHGWLRDWVKD